ncbi:ABC-2 family transporter protein [Pseudomonas sp. PB3P13]
MHILTLVLNAVKEEARYKINLVGAVLALLTLYSLQFIFFDVISSLVDSDKNHTNWLLIFFMSYALGGLIISFFSSAITGFFRQLTLGRVDTLLVRPVNVLVLILFRWSEVHYLLVALLLTALCILSNKIDFFPFAVSAFNTSLYVVALLAGVVAGITFLLGLSSFSFITQRELPVDYIHASVFTFALLPENFYSKALLYFLVAALPMIVFASVALDALYNGLTAFVSIFLCAVVVTSGLVLNVVYRLFNRFDSVGG